MLAVPGVLIEGSDYAGKSTIARILVDLLQAKGLMVEIGKCYLSKNPLITFLDAQAQQSDDLLVRDKYYSAAIVCDLEMARTDPPKLFRLQERHWLSQLGRNLFFHPKSGLIPDGYLERRHFVFSIQVMLYSDVPSKKRRGHSRDPASPRDRLLLADPELHQAYDDFIVSLLPTEEAWMIIDVSDASAEEIATQIFGLITAAAPVAAFSSSV